MSGVKLTIIIRLSHVWGLREQRRALICAPGKAKISFSLFLPFSVGRSFLLWLDSTCFFGANYANGYLRHIETHTRGQADRKTVVEIYE